MHGIVVIDRGINNLLVNCVKETKEMMLSVSPSMLRSYRSERDVLVLIEDASNQCRWIIYKCGRSCTRDI